MHENGSNTLIALGANLPSEAGPPAQTLSKAISALAGSGLVIRAVSRFFETPCFPAGAGPDYVNAALVARTTQTAPDILACLHAVEARFGRERQERWGMRTLDLDLLALGDRILPDRETQRHWMELPADRQRTQAPDRLVLPHPRMHERAFVLVPLCDVAPDWRHPVLGRTVRQMTAALAPSALAELRAL